MTWSMSACEVTWSLSALQDTDVFSPRRGEVSENLHFKPVDAGLGLGPTRCLCPFFWAIPASVTIDAA